MKFENTDLSLRYRYEGKCGDKLIVVTPEGIQIQFEGEEGLICIQFSMEEWEECSTNLCLLNQEIDAVSAKLEVII